MAGFLHVAKGDEVLRLLTDQEIPMKLTVCGVTDDLIYCGPQAWYDDNPESCWTFDRVTGAEVNHELGWGPQYGITGSRLTEVLSRA